MGVWGCGDVEAILGWVAGMTSCTCAGTSMLHIVDMLICWIMKLCSGLMKLVSGIPLVKSLSIYIWIGVYHQSSKTSYIVCFLQDELLRIPGTKSSLSPILWWFIQFVTCNKCGSKSSHLPPHSSNGPISQTAYVERKEDVAWQGQDCREGG